MKEWKSSGLSRKQYCVQHDLNKNTFDSWARNENFEDSKKFVPVEVEGVKESVIANYFLINSDNLEIKLPANTEENLVCKIIREIAKCI